MFKNNPLFFINSLFFQHTIFVFEKLCFAENTMKRVFQEMFKNTVSKTHFFNHVKKHLFAKKGVIFAFLQFLLKPLFYSVSCFTLFWSKKHLAKTDSCNENARCYFPFLTQIVSANFPKKSFFDFSHFWMTTLKKPIFIGFLGFFPFRFFPLFCFSLSNIKKTKTKNAIFYSKTSFLINPHF